MLNISMTKPSIYVEKKLLHSRINWQKGIKKGANNAGISVVKRTRTLLNTGIRTGRKYKNLPNTSSAPGEMPRTQSGRLEKGLYSRTGGTDNFRVGASAPYAAKLSEGDPLINLRPRKSAQDGWLIFVINQEHMITRKYLEQGVMKEIY